MRVCVTKTVLQENAEHSLLASRVGGHGGYSSQDYKTHSIIVSLKTQKILSPTTQARPSVFFLHGDSNPGPKNNGIFETDNTCPADIRAPADEGFVCSSKSSTYVKSIRAWYRSTVQQSCDTMPRTFL